MAKTTLGEEIYLRALTGKMVGEAILSEYNKIAVISPKNIICAAISAAMEAAFVSSSGGRAGHFVVEKHNVKETVEKVKEFSPEAVVLMFGGETPIEQTKELFVSTLKEMAALELDTEIIFHVRIFAAGGVEDAVKDNAIKDYLSGSVLFVYTVDLERGLLLYNALSVEEDSSLYIEKIEEYPVTAEHAELLNRSLRDRTISWKEIN